MGIADRIAKLFKTLLPAPFTIAVLLTFLTIILAFGITRPDDIGAGSYFIDLLEYWENGLWNNGLLVFAMQMMLMLVLGHVLALTSPAEKLIRYATQFCTTTAKAAAIVTFFTLLVALFNWGLGLIFGAIFARKVAERTSADGIKLNYPLIGAAGYSGLMVWHGGISGSAPVKAADPGHLADLMSSTYTTEQIAQLPDAVPFTDTVFSSMNFTISAVLLIVLPALMYFLGKSVKSKTLKLNAKKTHIDIQEEIKGAERIDNSKIAAYLFGGIILFIAIYKAFIKPETFSFNFITPNFINFTLLGLGIVLHKNFKQYLNAIDDAIGGASGILIQFPLYFGIIGIMTSSGLATIFSDFFVSLSKQTASPETAFPIFTFFSAGIVNVFVPSGGGQWGVQGPIIIQASQDLGIPLGKSIMALAYGDQLTNMLQPFWALPLLGITGLKAKEILPYTLILMLAGTIIFILGLLLF